MGAFRFQTVVAQPTQPRAHRHRCERDRRVDDEREHWWAWPVTEMAFAVAPPPVVPPLRPPVALVGWRRRPRATPPRFAVVLAASSGVSGERAPPTFGRLREELLQLHAEADLTQSKANSARVRLVRLTEAAENLKKRAATSVRMGKENEAVDLLVQKKKLTKALENIKERIEVLDKLSAKISEAISIKQNMLIEYALHPGMSNSENSDDMIRVFSSTVNDGVNGAESCDSHLKSVEKESFELRNEAHASMTGYHEQSAFRMADGFSFLNDPDPANSIKNTSSYDGFLEHIDLQMKSLEYEIEQFISSQSVDEVGSEKQRNDKWQRLSDIQMLVKETRERIARILDLTVKETESGDLR
ncbi:uncharacterized protein [Setaria viridis]|uniref:Uncharacterized protein n=1 Tax=Setaria viridis TaxID=4556 RepID=A0A4U6UL55_SETVI|nr:uncharacterized protein LOC117857471 [Setaria viridis]XP_034596029.1 uncharacterized protein LOC117857471 [Setaria viridis]TKW16222.1 hypothetical protein SEVIR_5G285900v2 [Setaria viridis]